MIEILRDFPETVVALSASGRVTRQDYEKVLIPKVQEALARHDRIRCYYELGAGFSGFDGAAVWEDLKLGIEHLARWERVAVVTDVEWIRLAVNFFRFLVPGEARVFATAQAAEARRWIAA
jgi:SpoIIAA-like